MNIGGTSIDLAALIPFMVIMMFMGVVGKVMGDGKGVGDRKFLALSSRDLNSSIREELKAASSYRQKAARAHKLGDTKTGDLYLHTAKEEDKHYSELAARVGQLPSEERERQKRLKEEEKELKEEVKRLKEARKAKRE